MCVDVSQKNCLSVFVVQMSPLLLTCGLACLRSTQRLKPCRVMQDWRCWISQKTTDKQFNIFILACRPVTEYSVILHDTQPTTVALREKCTVFGGTIYSIIG